MRQPCSARCLSRVVEYHAARLRILPPRDGTIFSLHAGQAADAASASADIGYIATREVLPAGDMDTTRAKRADKPSRCLPHGILSSLNTILASHAAARKRCELAFDAGHGEYLRKAAPM